MQLKLEGAQTLIVFLAIVPATCTTTQFENVGPSLLQVGEGGGERGGRSEFPASNTLYFRFPPPYLVVTTSVFLFFCCKKLRNVVLAIPWSSDV